MIERLPAHLAGAGSLADFEVGQRVQTKGRTSTEVLPGIITDIQEGPADLTTYEVTLDGGMGGGEYAEAEIWPEPATAQASLVDASVEHTAVDDYPELGTVLLDRPPPKTAGLGIRVGSVFDFAAQAAQYPSAGPDGVSYFKGDMGGGKHVDCLLYRKDGKLVGILNHYPFDFPPYEAKGNSNVMVDPDYQRQGIASALLREGIKRWNIDLDSQDYTESGSEFIKRFQASHTAGTKIAAKGPLPEHLAPYWGNRPDDPRDSPVFCARQSRKTPAIPWHNGYPKCRSCGKDWSGKQAALSPYARNVLTQHTESCIQNHQQPSLENWCDAGHVDPWTYPLGSAEFHAAYEKFQEFAGEGAAILLDSSPEDFCTCGGAKHALYLPLHNDTFAPSAPAGPGDAGTTDGKRDGVEGLTRTPAHPEDPDYMAAYEMAWANGVEVGRKTPELNSGDLAGGDEFGDVQAPNQLTGGAKTAGPLWDLVKGDPKPSESYTSPGRSFSYDWCRFRKDHHCYLAKDLNAPATKLAGYAVWVPYDRGHCWRIQWKDQKLCPAAEPGPHSREKVWYADATVPWDQGGQRGRAGPQYPHAASLGAGAIDPEMRFHVTASWSDVRTKAKRIRDEGGVRILSSMPGVIVGHVKGDTNVYETELVRTPGRQSTASWSCGCKWASYSWGRSGPWKKYQGRMCSHSLALQYEAQSRGMFGREITEDQQTPNWLDPTIPVRTPGDYDRDKGRYSSLDVVKSSKSAEYLRPVEDQHDEDPAPLHLMAYAMLSEGKRYAEVRAMISGFGADPVEIVRTARSVEFVAQVRGLLKRLRVEGDKILDSAGQVVSPREIVYPGWHPTLGLGLNDRKAASSPVQAVRPRTARRKTAGTDPLISAKALSALAARYEPTVTDIMVGLAQGSGGEMIGLKHKLKGVDRMAEKIADRMAEHGGNSTLAAMDISDSLRYTMELPIGNYTEATRKTLAALLHEGMKAALKNYWERGDAYNGANSKVTLRGHLWELQFHTPASFEVKEKTHPMYEIFRVSNDPKQRKELDDEMTTMSDKLPIPPSILTVPTLTRQPKASLDVTGLSSPKSKDETRYLRLTDRNDQLLTVIRHARTADDSRIEVWRGGRWVMDNTYGDQVFRGSSLSDEITEDEAKVLIGGLAASPVRSKESSVNDRWGVFAALQEIENQYLSDARPAALPVVQAEVIDEFGMLLPGEPSYDRATWTMAGPNTIFPDPDTSMSPGFDDEPEPALPVTYGDDEVSVAAARVTAALTGQPVQELVANDGKALLAEHNERVYRLANGLSVEGLGPDPFAHLDSVEDSSDVQAAAASFLASRHPGGDLTKTALRDFSAAERQQLIDEGIGVEATNLDLLQIADTHYAQIENVLTTRTDVDDDSWQYSDLEGED